MSTLHLVRQSAFVTSDLAQCLSMVNKNDTIILMDDGCYNISHTLLRNFLNSSDSCIDINIINTHAKARAIKAIEKINRIEIVDIVKLTFIHTKVITWQ